MATDPWFIWYNDNLCHPCISLATKNWFIVTMTTYVVPISPWQQIAGFLLTYNNCNPCISTIANHWFTVTLTCSTDIYMATDHCFIVTMATSNTSTTTGIYMICVSHNNTNMEWGKLTVPLHNVAYIQFIYRIYCTLF